MARPQRRNVERAEIRDVSRMRMLSGGVSFLGVEDAADCETADRSLRKPNDICPAT